MLQCGEFAAWVSIDGKETQEYGIEVSEDGKSVTCWIASELGKKFSVHWQNISYKGDVSGRIHMDGTSCQSRILRGEKLPSATMLDGVVNGHSVKPFVFSSLELTDDESFLDRASHQGLGLIELRIVPIRITKKTQEIYSHPFPNAFSEVKVHERSKKAITQQITLAEPEFVAIPYMRSRTEVIGPDLIKFSFKYRPADILRANGIMPSSQQLKRKASSEMLHAPTPDRYDEADAKEEKMLRERLNVLEAKRLKTEKDARVKDDPDMLVDLTKEGRKKVKRENQPAFVQGEIIDLT
ncbi:hypothetical protein MSAN_00066200 [Mycena sanguinolenta]|uniref:DUF7918 domain-containing protein n=1 Tax=Mycena sanguinolenta TaxID=230812 RepID=A0A8H6ZCG8_9AGAR|nr:hypothetical protein MSAN_00066200 [Mycena sanguinolenta]